MCPGRPRIVTRASLVLSGADNGRRLLAERSADVVVVGAGVAGLVAATRLQAAGHEVAVLEARDRVGGRTLNRELPGTNQMIEMGGQWVGPTQDRILSLISELGLSTYPTYDEGKHTVEFKGRLRRYSGNLPWLGTLSMLDIGQAQLALDRAAARIDTSAPWTGPHAELNDKETFADWLRRRVRTSGGDRFFRSITEAVFAAGPEEMSALWALFYIGAAGGLDPLINTRGGAQQDRVEGGTQLIALRLAAGLGDAVTLRAPVTAVDWSDSSGVRVSCDFGSVRARRVVLAVPPALAGEITYTPNLPAARRSLIAGMPMGSVIKVNVVYDRPFWREAGLSGQAISDVRGLSATFDNTPASGSPPVLVGFFEARHARAAGLLSTGDRRKAILQDLAAYFGPRARDAVDVLEQDWSAEPWSRGCYGAFATPGTLTGYGAALREPIGPIHFAGTETATRWAGYLDGAVQSGERVAREVVTALAGRPDPS